MNALHHALATLSALIVGGLTAQPVAATELVKGSYAEAIRCAAVNTILVGAVKQDDASQLSAEDQATATAAEEHAVSWLVMAITLNPKGDTAAKADFSKEIDALAEAVMKAEGAEAFEQAIGKDLMHCIAREADLFN